MSATLVTTKEGQVLDFYHLWLERASRATLHRLYDDGRDMGEVRREMDLMLGESVVLTPRVYYRAQELAGMSDGQWSVDPPVASVLGQGIAERRRLVGTAPGKAILTVAAVRHVGDAVASPGVGERAVAGGRYVHVGDHPGVDVAEQRVWMCQRSSQFFFTLGRSRMRSAQARTRGGGARPSSSRKRTSGA